jgi:uncharacterized protein YhfF
MLKSDMEIAVQFGRVFCFDVVTDGSSEGTCAIKVTSLDTVVIYVFQHVTVFQQFQNYHVSQKLLNPLLIPS